MFKCVGIYAEGASTERVKIERRVMGMGSLQFVSLVTGYVKAYTELGGRRIVCTQ